MWIFPGSIVSLIVVSITISVVLFFIMRTTERTFGWLKIVLINFAAIYLLIIGSVFLYDLYLTQKLSEFDLNGDGIFSGAEITKKQVKYFKLDISDTGRRLAPFTGFIYAFLYSLFFGYILKLISKKK